VITATQTTTCLGAAASHDQINDPQAKPATSHQCIATKAIGIRADRADDLPSAEQPKLFEYTSRFDGLTVFRTLCGNIPTAGALIKTFREMPMNRCILSGDAGKTSDDHVHQS
jgi:hypothetical protein